MKLKPRSPLRTPSRPSYVAGRLWASLAVFALGLGCTTAPRVPVRRTAVVAGPKLVSRRGLPLREGQLSIAVEANSMLPNLESAEFSGPTDPAMHVPEVQGGAHLYLAASDWIEFGVQVSLAPKAWTVPTSRAVVDHPGDDPVAFGFGPGLRLNLPMGGRLSLSLAGQVDLAFTPTAEFETTSGALRDSGTDLRFAPAGALVLAHRTTDWLGVYLSAGMARGVRNRALDVVDGAASVLLDDPPDTFGYSYYPVGGGIELSAGDAVVRFDVFHVFEDVPGFDPGLGFALQLGGKIQIWEAEPPPGPRAPRPRPSADPELDPTPPEEENLDDDEGPWTKTGAR